jgi:hypothetical protein
MGGQEVNASARRHRAIARDLRAAVGELTCVAEAIEKILGSSKTPGKAETRRGQP